MEEQKITAISQETINTTERIMEGQKITAISQETIDTTERIMEGPKITAISQETINTTYSNENHKADLNGTEKEKASDNNTGGLENLSGIVFRDREDLGNLLKHNFPGNKSAAVAAAESDAEGDGLPQDDSSSSSSSSALRPKKSPDSAEGDGSVGPADDDEEERDKNLLGFNEREKKKIPIYERFIDRPDIQVAKVHLGEVDGYYTFAAELQYQQKNVEDDLEDDVPHVLWPWHGYHTEYMGVKDGMEEPLNPILVDWTSFVTKLEHIVVKRQEDDNLLPVTIHGAEGTEARTRLHSNFVNSLESFINVLHYACIGWLEGTAATGGYWPPKAANPNPIKDPLWIGKDHFDISYYDSNGRELKAPWDEDEDEDEGHENDSGGTHSDLTGDDDDVSSATTGDIDQATQLQFEEMYTNLRSIVIREKDLED